MRHPAPLAVLAAWLVGLGVPAAPLLAQRAAWVQVGARPVPGTSDVAPRRAVTSVHLLAPPQGARSRLDDADRRRWAPVASLLLPGLGQVVLHQDRFVAYLAVEAWTLLEFANQRTEARRQQNRYRGLARNVARSLYGEFRPVGSWPYYEAMEHYVESGVYDRFPGGEPDPELDVSTYNGAMWLLAQQTFWADPNLPALPTSDEFRRAMNFYIVRAVHPEYRWSWRNAQLEQDLYVRTIRRSNTSFRDARRALGIVIANHLLSSVDAFVTLRVEGLEGGSGRGVTVRGRLPLP